jgi:hypothetical protein
VIAVPRQIIGKWSSRQWTWLLRHEGEHVRSRDTLIVWLLGWTKALVWWNPFVHALVEQWSQAREEICDMAAVRGGDDSAAYSGFLLDIAAGSRASSPLLLYMAASRPARRLRARMVAMLDQRPVRRRASRLFQIGALAIMAFIAAIVSCVGLKAEDAPAIKEPKTGIAPSSAPQKVKFVTGPKQFAEGDEIVIDKVMCSSSEFKPGDKVVVQGHYRLTSIPEAQLALYLTHWKGDGREKAQPTQYGDVKSGSGAFEREYTIQTEGSLHLSFYDMTKGKLIGGVYFGTQQQVDHSKAWHPGMGRLVFSSQSVERKRDHSVPAQSNVQPAKRPSPDPEVSDVKFVTGRNQFAEDDEIVIDKVMCSSGEFKAGDKVVVQGHYKLTSVPEAQLALSLTTSANGGRGRWQAEQYGDVKRGSGTFERIEFIDYEGSLHVSFYDMTTGKSIGGIYFGTQKQVDPPK